MIRCVLQFLLVITPPHFLSKGRQTLHIRRHPDVRKSKRIPLQLKNIFATGN